MKEVGLFLFFVHILFVKYRETDGEGQNIKVVTISLQDAHCYLELIIVIVRVCDSNRTEYCYCQSV